MTDIVTDGTESPPFPALPARLARLKDVALNLRWSWHAETAALFRRLDERVWEESYHNPVLTLQWIGRDRLEAAATDPDFLAHLDRVTADLDAYLAGGGTWFDAVHGGEGLGLVAYFSMEFGLTECLPIYSGGLGVLAGDHLKSASDLGVPLVGVGLFYRRGYFRQLLDDAGWQRDADEDNDPERLPMEPARRPDGTPLTVELAFPGRPVAARVWRLRVGRVDLYLLDTDVDGNAPEDRAITARLYGGDVETRIRQEIVLGIGGHRALEALGLAPAVCHMNEGHAAFLSLERARRLMERTGLPFAEARAAAAPGLVFTTHTPVAAGHDYFPPDLMERYLGDYAGTLGLSPRDLLALGRRNPDDAGEWFCQTILALRMAGRSNGVSRLHGAVSRRMWRDLWPGLPEDEVPIGYVTNGVHLPTWRAAGLAGPAAPDGELWAARERGRAALIRFTRDRLRAQGLRHGLSERAAAEVGGRLDPAALTIGFARRFATYKRATLLLRDPARLARLLNDPARPVQVIFAGKAHPRDEGGKALIRQIVELSRQEAFGGRLVFLEGYDMAVARALVQGADVWLNNPQRPYEASGTSGMKAAANGALNVSTLDGWWVEAWEEDADDDAGAIGWAIGRGEQFEDPEQGARVEAEALYELLEREVAPAFYERGAGGVPPRWIARMRASIERIPPVFNTDRMVREYTERFYLG
ncbi:MAG: alpha-glucan family phosphorylase [Chloroflexota bacterium]|nr:alpha-glucan family phosphorylase [Chloroflexota bacterium]